MMMSLAIQQMSGWKFDHLNITIQQCLYEALFASDGEQICKGNKATWSTSGVGLFMSHGASWVSVIPNIRFLSGSRQHFSNKLEWLGDTAADAEQHDEAISHYTAALLLDPPSTQGIFVKWCKSFMETCLWKQALDDANQACHSCLCSSISLTYHH